MSNAGAVDSFIGTPNYGEKKTKGFKIEDGDNVYRILPPCGNLAQEGVWAVQHVIHWGWNGELNKWVTFRCIEKEDYRTKVITQSCPACDAYGKKAKAMEQAKAAAEAEGKSGKELKEWLAPHRKWLDAHNLERKYNMNAMDQSGTIGLLKIGWNHWKALRVEMAALAKRNPPLDPVGVNNGVFFNFHRGEKYTDTVRVVTESKVIEGNSYDTPKLSTLTPDIVQRMRREAKLLDTLNRTLTYNEIKLIVDSKGDPRVVDSVVGAPEGQGAPASTRSVFESEDEVAEAAPQKPTKTTPLAPEAPAQGPQTGLNELEALRAKLAAMETQLQQAPKPVAQPEAPVAVPTQSGNSGGGMSDDVFLARFGKK